MSLEDLQVDLEDNIASMAALTAQGPLVTAQDVVNHLQNTMWPFLKNTVAEMTEMDDTIADMYQNAEDILQPETAAQFQAIITGAVTLLSHELVKRLNKDNVQDKKILLAIREWLHLAKAGQETLVEITVAETETGEAPIEEADEDEEDDEDDDDDGDEDEDGDEDDEAPIDGKGK